MPSLRACLDRQLQGFFVRLFRRAVKLIFAGRELGRPAHPFVTHFTHAIMAGGLAREERVVLFGQGDVANRNYREGGVGLYFWF